MKFKKNLLFFLTILLSSCGVKTNSNSINSINSKETNSTNSRVSISSNINSDTTSNETDDYPSIDYNSEDFIDYEDNQNYYFYGSVDLEVEPDSDTINLKVAICLYKKVKYYDKYLSIQYTFINLQDGHYIPNSIDDPSKPLTPIKQGTPIFIQKQTKDFFDKHFYYNNGANYYTNLNYYFDIQIPGKEFIKEAEETEYSCFALTFCEFTEANGYTYTNGVKDEYHINTINNNIYIYIQFYESMRLVNNYV